MGLWKKLFGKSPSKKSEKSPYLPKNEESLDIRFTKYFISNGGFFLYNDFNNQPQITRDFFYMSSNHIYTFFLISILGLFSFESKKKLFVYLICLSIVLEFFHLVIPNRSFQTGDLNGNLLGVIMPFLIYKVYEILFRAKK